MGLSSRSSVCRGNCCFFFIFWKKLSSCSNSSTVIKVLSPERQPSAMGTLGRNCITKGGTDIGSQEVNPKPLVHTEESWERPLKIYIYWKN